MKELVSRIEQSLIDTLDDCGLKAESVRRGRALDSSRSNCGVALSRMSSMACSAIAKGKPAALAA